MGGNGLTFLIIVVVINLVGAILKAVAKKKEEQRQAELLRNRKGQPAGSAPSSPQPDRTSPRFDPFGETRASSQQSQPTASRPPTPVGVDPLVARRQAQLEELRRRREAAASPRQPTQAPAAERIPPFHSPSQLPNREMIPPRVQTPPQPKPVAPVRPSVPVAQSKKPADRQKQKRVARQPIRGQKVAERRDNSRHAADPRTSSLRTSKQSAVASALQPVRVAAPLAVHRSPVAELFHGSNSAGGLRRAMLLSEILGPPVSARSA